MPIRQDIFAKSPNQSYIVLSDLMTLDQLAQHVKDRGAESWWVLLIKRANNVWDMISLNEVEVLFAEIGDDLRDFVVSQLPLAWKTLTSVEQDSMNTGDAEDLAQSSPHKLLVVTAKGVFVGLLNQSHHRASSVNQTGKALKELLNTPESTGNEDKEKAADSIHFTAYAPAKAAINIGTEITVYAHTHNAVSEIEQDMLQRHLSSSNARRSKTFANLKPGTPITIIPECEGIEFEPPALKRRWLGNWIAFPFHMLPQAELEGEDVLIRFSITVEQVEIASIQIGIHIGAPDRALAAVQHNPLYQQKLQGRSAIPYQKIFVSYSRKDSEVVHRYKLAQLACGNDVFLDVDNLRAGENWQAALAEAIDASNFVQLFWSEHSASSKYCLYELDYALKTRSSAESVAGFIRPVYWQKPMPNPPDALGTLNFKYVPFQE
jgi:hypothetical protein